MVDSNMLGQVIAIAREAGAEIMRIYAQEDFGATSKADDSPLTLADLASHRAIVVGLQKLTPTIPVLSEEAANIPYAERKDWQRFWLVDPLDGTKEFIKRNGEFTVNIALIEKGVPILGVVYAPVLDVCYCGAAGLGAFKIQYVCRSDFSPTTSDESLSVGLKLNLQGGCGSGFSPTSTLPPLTLGEGWDEGNAEGEGDGITPIHTKSRQENHPIKVVASRSHSDERTASLLAKLGEHECISMGSSLKLCLVAEGAAHFYPRLGPTMEWDTAAAHAVVNAAGGTVHDKEGRELRYNKQNLHNPEFFVHDSRENRLQRPIKES